MQLLLKFSRSVVLGLFGVAFALGFGCESQRCVGDHCPDACNGVPCGSLGSATASAGGSTPGRYTSCSSDAVCDTTHGFRCALGSCLYACRSHFDCAGVGLCQELELAGQMQLFCVPGPMPEKVGQFYTNCPTGAECDQESGFFCRSAGVGDLDSYCTASCTDDEQCPSGFLCDTVSGTPCEDDCDVAGDAADPECVPSSEIGDGKAYRCGLLGIERNICVKRRFCADCETDDDCRAVPGLICAKDASGEKICTPPCDPNLDSCPWGNAATCGVWDDERGIATCTHRFQSCHGSGLPCEPCYRQSDCGSNGICSGSTFTGERYCVDLNVQCSCQGEPVSAEGLCVGGGCPESPGGLEMQCYIGASGNGPGVCLFANANPNPLLASPQTGCWGPL